MSEQKIPRTWCLETEDAIVESFLDALEAIGIDTSNWDGDESGSWILQQHVIDLLKKKTCLEWSETPPDSDGWYWKLDHGRLDVVRVKRQRAYGDRLCCLHGADYGPVDQAVNALWAGPIPHPVEP